MTTASSRVASIFRPKILLIVLAAIAILYGAHRIGAGPWLTNALDWIRGSVAGAACVHRDLYRGVRRVSPRIDPDDWRRRDFRRGARIDLRFDRRDARRDRRISGGPLPRARLGEPRLEGNAKFKAIDEAVGKEGWKIVILTRLSRCSIQPAQLRVRADERIAARLLFRVVARDDPRDDSLRVYRLA